MLAGLMSLLDSGGGGDDKVLRDSPTQCYIGQPVHFVRPAWANAAGAHVAAIVTYVYEDGQTVDLNVQYNGRLDREPTVLPNGRGLRSDETERVPYDDAKIAGTWHEIEEAADSAPAADRFPSEEGSP